MDNISCVFLLELNLKLIIVLFFETLKLIWFKFHTFGAHDCKSKLRKTVTNAFEMEYGALVFTKVFIVVKNSHCIITYWAPVKDPIQIWTVLLISCYTIIDLIMPSFFITVFLIFSKLFRTRYTFAIDFQLTLVFFWQLCTVKVKIVSAKALGISWPSIMKFFTADIALIFTYDFK